MVPFRNDCTLPLGLPFSQHFWHSLSIRILSTIFAMSLSPFLFSLLFASSTTLGLAVVQSQPRTTAAAFMLFTNLFEELRVVSFLLYVQ